MSNTKTPSRFSDEDLMLAKKVQDTYGVPASVTLAQYALESGYGQHTSGVNNYFGVKGNGRNGYRNYSSKEASFMDYGAILSKDRYTSRTNNARNLTEYVQGVKDGGYAEDPNYVKKVMGVIRSNGLDELFPYNKDTLKNTSVQPTNMSNTDFVWWGDIVRVVIILLLVVGCFVLLATSVTGFLPSKADIASSVLKGVADGD